MYVHNFNKNLFSYFWCFKSYHKREPPLLPFDRSPSSYVWVISILLWWKNSVDAFTPNELYVHNTHMYVYMYLSVHILCIYENKPLLSFIKYTSTFFIRSLRKGLKGGYHCRIQRYIMLLCWSFNYNYINYVD